MGSTGILSNGSAGVPRTILLFGPQALSFNKYSLEKLRLALSGDGPPLHRWSLDAVKDLPRYWDELVKAIPEIADVVPGSKLLAELDSWLRNGIDYEKQDGSGLPNIILTPLVVLTQLTQYWRYLELNSAGTETTDLQNSLVAGLHSESAVETLGFCTGLLSAFAVASSSNRLEFERYGAVAVRLSMLVGALVDAQEAWNDNDGGLGGPGLSTSYATGWQTNEQRVEMTRILDELFPEAYISVLYDESRATVTTSKRAASRLLERLRASGITAAEVGLRGRFHNPDAATSRHVDTVVALCNQLDGLQFPDAARLALPSYTNNAGRAGAMVNNDGSVAHDAGSLHEIALRSILVQQCDWYGTFSRLGINPNHTNGARPESESPLLISFGPDRCVPPTLMRRVGPRLVHFADMDEKIPRLSESVLDPEVKDSERNNTASFGVQVGEEEPIAVVGMSIKVAGADDLVEFGQMLRTGKSQHIEIGSEQLMMDTLFREGDKDPSRKWYGNFIRDPEAFDHKFFKRSPRESATMDPQQRLFLQAAYQAVEQSGYFTETNTQSSARDTKHVGVYLGACAGDYEHHAACHTPNAFTATGNLKSFIPGKVSHYFGWTGPSMTFDTACSASAVAIHTACRNLLSGECTAALAGGVATMTNYLWFQNLAGASFLSPTGQCKPFDESADGYCRAEGIACVFLKRLSDAVADGNPILGCIASTAVYQNQNCTPLFVPNSPSLSQLFCDVTRKANFKPSDVSLVEAHGTGTPVGDPAEYESIRLALGGPGIRPKPLPIGSVKGHIGHTEGASGVISLIKIIVMMHGGFIPPQASFSTMSHHIPVKPDDSMEVVTSLRPWTEAYKVALINNYGASGSNASMIVTQPPKSRNGMASLTSVGARAQRLPFWIAGLDARSIGAYCAKVDEYLESCGVDVPSIADISFALNRQANRSLAQGLTFSCGSITELRKTLSSAATSPTDAGIAAIKPERPVILCFGGQVSTSVGLDRNLYDSVAILRHHLDRCDAAARAAGLPSLFPAIFSRELVADPVVLQTMLFASQYACARSWLDCLVPQGKAANEVVVAVVGHSFGEITALCVSGALSLDDALFLVAGRARLVRDAWDEDRGAMMAVEADESVVHILLTEANATYYSSGGNNPASIACYNGPRSFTLAGATKAIDTVADILAANSSGKFSGIRSKRLNVSNAFHSALVEPLMDGLEEVGKSLNFNEPTIPLERATEARSSSGELSASFVPEHMRQPVYFNHAIQRLAKEHPSAVFLEAGSNSTITIMANRALATSDAASSCHFQAISLTNTDKGVENLTDSTVALWNQGVRVCFWPHHARQGLNYSPVLLPPYQFEKARHWLELKSPIDEVKKAAAAMGPSTHTNVTSVPIEQDEKNMGLWTFVSTQDADSKVQHRFRVNTKSDKYNKFVSGHLIVQTAPICPATLEVDMAIEALFSIHAEWREANLQPVVLDMVNHAPICADFSRTVWLDFEPAVQDTASDDVSIWTWRIISTGNNSDDHAQTHVEAKLHIRAPSDATYQAEFARYERLVSHKQCVRLLDSASSSDSDEDDNEVDVLQGRNVYRVFGEIVDYGELYRGVRSVVGRRDECAGSVRMKRSGESWLDVPLSDSFSQVAGIWVNCMTDCDQADMFIATGCEISMRSPRVAQAHGEAATSVQDKQSTWHVFARHTRQSEKLYMSDVFVFDAQNGMLIEVMLGIQYARVAKASMSRMLTRLTTDESVLKIKPSTAPAGNQTASTKDESGAVSANASTASATNKAKPGGNGEEKKKKKAKSSGRPDITEDVKNLIANVSGIEASEITPDSELADFGIDSLMGMELAREVEVVFKCKLDQTELMDATSLRKFVVCISHALFGPGDIAAPSAENDDEEVDEEDDDTDDKSPDSWSDNSNDASTAPSTPNNGTGSRTPTEKPVTEPAVSGSAPSKHSAGPSAVSKLQLSRSDILQCFGEVKMLADKHLHEYHLDNIDRVIIAASNRLCTALVVEAFDQLGSPLRKAAAGEIIPRVPFLPQHQRLMDFVYEFLEHDARLIDIDKVTGQLKRTGIAIPRKRSSDILQELLNAYPEFVVANRLTAYAGGHLAGVLSGETDGIRVIFGSIEGRELVKALYCEHTFNRMNYGQMRDVIGRLAERVRHTQPGETLKILEMGAGTGGTTHVLAPYLLSLGIPVEYTFTDLSASMVANARRKFGEQYPFMRFAVHDIEKPPAEDLRNQHIVLASNAIHATHNLVVSATNIRSALRPDGFLMMLEMTEVVPFIDLIFGLLEGWWLFDDGRKHAIVPAEHWERDLHAAGFGHVDWTDGSLPENTFQKVMIALASGPVQERLPKPSAEEDPLQQPVETNVADIAVAQRAADGHLAKYTADWTTTALESTNKDLTLVKNPRIEVPAVIILTGATGSLGSHLAATLAEHPQVHKVACLNRRSSKPAEQRQAEAFSSRGVSLSETARAKLRVLEVDTTKPQLGLSESDYGWLVRNGTHIVHNAWPMSGTRPLGAFEPQFRALRNLLDLARNMACQDGTSSRRIGFQLVSSIGVVGHTGEARVIERRVPLSSALPIGYCQAKWVCERMLDETLHKYPRCFRPAVVRPGQIAGSRTSGVWNPVEHFAFLIKSAQTLRAWPDFDGVLQWVPVNDVAGTMVDLLAIGDATAPADPHPVYHIDNPVGQPWKDMSPVLAAALGIPPQRIISFRDWVRLVRRSPLPAETENPAARLIDFLDHNFERMSCGGLILDTTNSIEHSKVMATLGPVSAEVARSFVSSWKRTGWLFE